MARPALGAAALLAGQAAAPWNTRACACGTAVHAGEGWRGAAVPKASDDRCACMSKKGVLRTKKKSIGKDKRECPCSGPSLAQLLTVHRLIGLGVRPFMNSTGFQVFSGRFQHGSLTHCSTPLAWPLHCPLWWLVNTGV